MTDPAGVELAAFSAFAAKRHSLNLLAYDRVMAEQTRACIRASLSLLSRVRRLLDAIDRGQVNEEG